MMFRVLVTTALLAAALALPTTGCSRDAPPSKAFDARVRAYLLEHPEVIEEALQKLEATRTARAEAAAAASVQDNRTKLERDPGDFVANPGGTRTMVEFFDYKCPYCKSSADAVVKLIKTHPDVRFVFKEFPILSEVSNSAAEDQLAALPQGKYLEVFQGLMDQPSLTAESAADVFKANGVDLTRAQAPEVRAAAAAHLVENRALAKTIGVEGTPVFLIGDKRIDGWIPEEIEAALGAAPTTKAPTPPPKAAS
jgi:protein-disulfide isomerase